ncbi:MAG: CtsR family transcriptional regulator [Synergistaceae bacterium]|nr:CtsR family transcriptional regulator [Synergistaceae bacterium]
MQNLSHDIENYILSLLKDKDEEENFISLRRKELAEMFECVPSQINYVLRSRFTPEHGYLIESRRGEHGYIKIFRITCESSDEKVSHIEELVGDAITLRDASKLLGLLQEREFITARERLLIEVALRNTPNDPYDTAELLRNMLIAVVED